MGRPALLTERLITDLALAVGKGTKPVTAAAARGISPATFYSWQARGRNPKGPLDDLCKRLVEAIGQARAIHEEYIDDVILNHAARDGRVALVLRAEYRDRSKQAAAKRGQSVPTLRVVIEAEGDDDGAGAVAADAGGPGGVAGPAGSADAGLVERGLGERRGPDGRGSPGVDIDVQGEAER